MDQATKARLRLYLRGEQSMGLKAVPFGATQREVERLGALSLSSEAEPSPPSPAVNPPGPGTLQRTLFGGDEDVMMQGQRRTPIPAATAFTTPVLPTEEKRRQLKEMDGNEVSRCTKCRLCEHRTHTVFGEGDVDAKVFFIGEGPGETEDQTGRPFVGRAGELLNKMIGAMGLKREQVYIANIVKCRPPGNRVPAPDEVATCTPYLQRQLEIVRPQAIVTLGLPATQYMLETKLSMGRLRGQWHAWRGIKLMPTYHPAYVLRNPSYETRAAVWSDLKKVLTELGMPVPKKNL